MKILRTILVNAILSLFVIPLGRADTISLDLTSSANGVYHYALHTPAHTTLGFAFFDTFFIMGLVNVTATITSGDLAPFGCNFVAPPFGVVECNDGFTTFDNSASNQPRDWGDLEVDAPGTLLGTASFSIEHFVPSGSDFVGTVLGPVALASVPEPSTLPLLGSSIAVLYMLLRRRLNLYV